MPDNNTILEIVFIRYKNVEDGFTIITPTQDKVLVCNGPHDNGIQVTNDGATILKSIGVDNPAAKVLVGQ